MPNTMANHQSDSLLEKRSVTFSSQTEQQIWELLLTGAKHIDDLVRSTGIMPGKLMSLLTLMEVSGKVKGIGNGMYMAV